MKWTLLSVAVAMLGMVGTANAGPVQNGNCCGPEKSCGCAPACQPICCKPVICRPQCHNVCTYQRHCCKPDCGVSDPGCCAPRCHRPSDPGCCPKPCCTPVDPGCCAPVCRPVDPGRGNRRHCRPVDPGCCPKPNCHAVDPGCCAPICRPVDPGCCPKPNCRPVDPGCCPKPNCKVADPCCKTCAPQCGTSAPRCGKACQNNCCNADPCEIAHWIYISQTACYARQRAKAIGVLGGRFDCRCNPEIMCAFIYGLNDCDERVRYRSAREIYRQLRRSNCCCLSHELVSALICALGDCDRHVRRTAERSLVHCGFEVSDCNNCSPAMAYVASLNNCGPAGSGPGCGTGCGNGSCGAGGPVGHGHQGKGPTANDAGPGASSAQPGAVEENNDGADVPAPEKEEPRLDDEKKVEAAPAPVPAAEPEAYFPSKLKTQSKSNTRKGGLANLFGQR